MTTENKNIKHEIINDFLPQKEFQEIQSAIMETNPIYNENIFWLYNSIATKTNEPKNWRFSFFTHSVFFKTSILSPFYIKLLPVLEKLEVKALIRIKCNLYPNSEKVHEFDEHADYLFPHKTAILYINTCNGYTKLKDGTKIDSVANRILLFDGSNPHQITTTSDQTARFIINFNYF